MVGLAALDPPYKTRMAIRLDCPRCKQPLAVPAKKAGGYVNCPRCSGRFWVAKDGLSAGASPAEATPVAAGPSGSGAIPSVGPTLALPPTVATVAAPIPPVAPARARLSTTPSTPTIAPMPLPAGGFSPGTAHPAPESASGPAPGAGVPAGGAGSARPTARKVARLITPEAAESTIKPSADGQLPALHLEEGEKKEKTAAKPTSIHPVVLFAALVVSIVLSVLMAVMDVDSGAKSGPRQRAEARQFIIDNYLAPRPGDHGQLQPYQVHLREALRAHSRGDRAAERASYRKVLDLLWAVPPDRPRGLTGAHKDDKDLEKNISILLSER